MSRISKVRSFGCVLLLGVGSLAFGGCAAAAVGAGGAAAGIAYTDRGAQSDVKGDVRQVNHQALAALQKMGIQVTGTEMKDSGKEHDVSAKSGTTDVSLKLVQTTADTTHVEVVAQEGVLKWNKDYAKKVLAQIINPA